MAQLWVCHWIYRINGQYLDNPFFLLSQNWVSLFSAQLSDKMVRCEKNLKNYHWPVFPYPPENPSDLTTTFKSALDKIAEQGEIAPYQAIFSLDSS